MGNCLSCFNKSEQQTPPNEPVEHTPSTMEEVIDSPIALSVSDTTQHTPSTKEEVIHSLQAISDPSDLHDFVRIIKQLLEEKKKSPHEASTSGSATEDKGSTSQSGEKKGMLTLFVTSGAKFLKFVNEHTEKIEDKKDLYCENSRVVAEILGQIGQLHWVVGGLAIAAYLIEKIDKVSANKTEALELLSKMVDLATIVFKLRHVIPEEEDKLKTAVVLVVQGSMMCVSQIYSEKIFSFLKTSINSEKLKEMSNRLDHLYKDLNLAITTEIAKRQLRLLPLPKAEYPRHAVGIENAQNEVIQLLNMETEDQPALLVAIYGFGGIGKTTLANAVVAMLNLNDYNYARVQLDQENNKNDLKKMQEVILKDAFAQGSIELRDCSEGRYRLKEAFVRQTKPVFLFIDNALRSEDLKELLPEDLSGLPKRSRVLLTTRRLDATDVFVNNGVKRSPFAMKTLDEDHAVEILCKEPENRERIKADMARIVRICGGVPLALRIVGGHLVKMGYNAGKCSQILDALEKGSHVKQENLTQRLIQFVYDELEEGTKEAFLDICWFFNGWIRRHVEYVVGAQEVKSLEEAALVTPLVVDKSKPSRAYEWSDFIYIGEEQLTVHDIVRAKGRSMSAATRFPDVESFSEAALDEVRHLTYPYLVGDGATTDDV